MAYERHTEDIAYFRCSKGLPGFSFNVTKAFGEELAMKQAPMEKIAVGAD